MNSKFGVTRLKKICLVMSIHLNLELHDFLGFISDTAWPSKYIREAITVYSTARSKQGCMDQLWAPGWSKSLGESLRHTELCLGSTPPLLTKKNKRYFWFFYGVVLILFVSLHFGDMPIAWLLVVLIAWGIM